MNKELVIKSTLKELGVTPGMLGYRYIVDAISSIVDDQDKLRNILKGLFADIARKHNTTVSRVERAIRHSIEVSYVQAPLAVIDNIFGNTVPISRDKPTSKQYLATVSDYVRDVLAFEEGA